MAGLRMLVASSIILAACGSASAPSTAPPSAPSTLARLPSSTSSATTTTNAGGAAPVETALRLLATEPVVTPADGEKYANPGAMVNAGGVYHMWRNSFSNWPGMSRTDHLTSADGIAWEPAQDAPMLTSADVPYTDNNAFPMSVIVDGDEWVAFFYTYDGQSNPAVIGRATAPGPDGPWVVDAEPVLTPGEEGQWDSLQVREPSVVKVGDEWRMYYTGSDRTGAAIGMATSLDGEVWTKHEEPVLAPGQEWWDSGSIGCPQVVVMDDRFVMTYDAAGRGAFGVGLATSADGLVWTPWEANPLITELSAPGAQQIWQSELLVGDGRLRWFLEVGPGATRTDVYAFEIDEEALDNPPVPSLSAETMVTGSSVIVRVRAIGLGVGFEAGSAERRLVHPHVYLDRDPPTDGEIVPLGDDTIVHSSSGTIVLRDLAPGDHVLWLVGADGTDHAVVPPEPVRIDVTIEP